MSFLNRNFRVTALILGIIVIFVLDVYFSYTFLFRMSDSPQSQTQSVIPLQATTTGDQLEFIDITNAQIKGIEIKEPSDNIPGLLIQAGFFGHRMTLVKSTHDPETDITDFVFGVSLAGKKWELKMSAPQCTIITKSGDQLAMGVDYNMLVTGKSYAVLGLVRASDTKIEPDQSSKSCAILYNKLLIGQEKTLVLLNKLLLDNVLPTPWRSKKGLDGVLDLRDVVMVVQMKE